MITPDYARTMARYNAWQNQWIYAAADTLTEEEREKDRGVFWGSIRRTLSHLVWADTIWIARFDGGPGVAPDSKPWVPDHDWPTLMAERPKLDARIAAWAWNTAPSDFEGDLHWYSGAMKRDMTKPKALCVMQVFNHQTHHRGQVHAVLTALGVKTQDTDLPFVPDEVPEWH